MIMTHVITCLASHTCYTKGEEGMCVLYAYVCMHVVYVWGCAYIYVLWICLCFLSAHLLIGLPLISLLYLKL